MTWQLIATAPKDGSTVLVYGKPSDIDGLRFERPGCHSAYWDSIDESFCLTGSTWVGPFIEPSHWMAMPAPPTVLGE